MDTNLATRHNLSNLTLTLPEKSIDIARLTLLSQSSRSAVITVIGKYNHGKSRLLNELIGHDIFNVADKRETTELSEYFTKTACWLDAPGLDADILGIDDQHAQDALWCKSDIRLFIHSMKEGELDATEQQLIQELYQDYLRSKRQTLIVLTQIDQIPDQEIYTKIIDSITQQVPEFKILPVSATRHRKGVENNKQLLIQKSGILALQTALDDAITAVTPARQHEKSRLLNEFNTQLNHIYHTINQKIIALQHTQLQQRQAFDIDLAKTLSKVCEDLRPIVEITGEDESLVADSFENMFKMTAGKLDRARLQVAYSHACIDINNHLIRYGVSGLPQTQNTNVQSLNTVIIAVLGISVKLRKDLKKIFFEAAGQERLTQEFTHYYETSTDRMTLQQQLDTLSLKQEIVKKALAELETGMTN